MLKYVLAPIHKDGWRFIAIFVVVTAILWWLWSPLGWLGLLATAWCIYFFRDPWRVSPQRDGLVISPADGRVIIVDEAVPPPELGFGSEVMQRVAIFMSVFDVHVNRAPMAGRVARMVYTEGKFVNASLDKASLDNERMAIRLSTAQGDIGVTQIAGLVARRIVTALREGQEVIPGQRIGLIRFGSRAEVFVPRGWAVLAIVGQRAVGGETVLADAHMQEPPRRGLEH
ncbi:MAG TPA: phosphatidylserine decarboxylase [Stellaceae bacterium]|nr:phosphatidylserine decarboxylase [Stellaceae bacterium]